MLFPERMILAEIACDRDIFQGIIDILHRSGSAEIEKSSILTGQQLRPRTVPDCAINDAIMMKARFEHVLDHLDAPYSPEYTTTVPVSAAIEHASKFIRYTNEIDETFAGLHSIETDISSERTRQEFISWLESTGIDRDLCRPSERMDVVCGVMRGDPPVISQNNTDDIMIVSSRITDMTFLIVIAPPVSDYADKIRKSADFSTVDCASPLRDINSLESIRKGLADVADSYVQMIPELQRALAACETYISAAEQMSRCADTDYCAHIACWIPEKSVRCISDDLQE
ncbi:MAG TPA: hypothetical protein PKK43_09600, partial [Spirochaetota bacterium]|nr:hypothetical protein [Spirochaetota bacterium]